jgi:class 3 adenylate cyclase
MVIFWSRSVDTDRLDRKLSAILMADVVGYSRLMGRDEVSTLSLLKACRRDLIDPAMAGHHGRIVQTAGDSFLAEFSSVVAAVQCAVWFQHEMSKRDRDLAEAQRLVFRVGINIGDVLCDGHDIFGDDVNIAARLEALCEPGGVCISRAAREQIRDKLPLDFTDHGERTVKNIKRPIGVFGLSADEIAAIPESVVAKMSCGFASNRGRPSHFSGARELASYALLGQTAVSAAPLRNIGFAQTQSPTNYRRAFWKSKQHAWLALSTVGLGFASGEPLGLLMGATLYALGIVFVPDLGIFHRVIDARNIASRRNDAAAQLAAFQQQQERLFNNLSAARRERYAELVAICSDIVASVHPTGARDLDQGARHQRLEEIVWTYLRLLAVEQSLDDYLQIESKEQVPVQLDTLETELQRLAVEVQTLKNVTPRPALLDDKERLLTSRLVRLDALQQRQRSTEQAQSKHDYLCSEQEGLVDKVKLIRAEAIAARNTDTLTGRLDRSIAELAAVNTWLSEISEFEDLTVQIPSLPVPPAAPADASRSARDANHLGSVRIRT